MTARRAKPVNEEQITWTFPFKRLTYDENEFAGHRHTVAYAKSPLRVLIPQRTRGVDKSASEHCAGYVTNNAYEQETDSDGKTAL